MSDIYAMGLDYSKVTDDDKVVLDSNFHLCTLLEASKEECIANNAIEIPDVINVATMYRLSGMLAGVVIESMKLRQRVTELEDLIKVVKNSN